MCAHVGIAKPGKHMTSTVCQAEMGVAEEEEDFEIVVGRLHEETR